MRVMSNDTIKWTSLSSGGSPLFAKNGKLLIAKAVTGSQGLAFQQRYAREGLIIAISSISWSRAAWRQ